MRRLALPIPLMRLLAGSVPGGLRGRAATPFWVRLAAVLSLLAVLSALLAPAAMLAQEVRSGKLGGICSAGMDWKDGVAHADGDTPASAHCDLCASMGLVLPPISARAHPGFGEAPAVAQTDGTLRPESGAGLPFSRGPPAA